MRRLLARSLPVGALLTGLLVPLALLVPVSPAAGAAASPASTDSRPSGARTEAQQVLDHAAALLTGGAGAAARREGAPADRVDATLALRDLRLVLTRLGAADRRTARSLLARPTDGRADPQGQGYSTRSARRCRGQVCVHFVRRSEDRATSAYVDTVLRVMGEVWGTEIGRLGYRAPVSDRALARSRNGGDGRFDVYLANLGADSLYGYCAPEFSLRPEPRRAGGYCVLDNDFSQAEFGRPPAESLAVTAAHEFFHAIQFGYDYREDRWFMESTATWVEERYADDVDDNQQYLGYGQVKLPGTSLDLFDRSGFAHYGNWAFWEHLTERYDVGLVRDVWDAARGTDYSLPALARVLRRHGGLTKRYAGFAAANLTPGESYAEGDGWPAQARSQPTSWTFAQDDTSRTAQVRIDHLASSSYVLSPAATLTGTGWRMEVRIDGPSRGASPAAWLVVRTVDGAWTSRQVPLDKRGRASLDLGFSADEVRAASITLANASTRYRCGQQVAQWSCQGVPRDQDKEFAVEATLSRR